MSSLFTMLGQKTNTRKRLVWFLVFFISLGVVFSAVSVSAQGLDTEAIAQNAGLPTVGLGTFIGRLLQIFFGLLGVIALALFMYGGFIWMTASGDPNKVEKAKKIIQNAIIGLIIIFSAFAITTFVMSVLGRYSGRGAGGDGNVLGGINDFGRSAIGGGPIESVYPKPNQVDIPINTRIAVTFKEKIDSASICDSLVDGKCSGAQAKNVEICETSSTGTACLADSPFNSSSTVSQTDDDRTFLFAPTKFLGAEDEKIRVFKVTLKNDIQAKATGDSIFKGFRTNDYAWQFKTNGKLDLDPPEVAKFEIYPNPDLIGGGNDGADEYTVGSDATQGEQTITVSGEVSMDVPAKVNGQAVAAGFSTKLAVPQDRGMTASIVTEIKSASGFDVRSGGTVSFTISSDGTSASFVNGDKLGLKSSSFPIINGRSIETGSGFSIETSADFDRGKTWSFEVEASSNGNGFSLMNGSSTIKDFIFVADNDARTLISKRELGDDGKTIIDKNYIAVKKGADAAATASNVSLALNANAGDRVVASASGAVVTIRPKNAGLNNLKMVASGAGLSVGGSSLSGSAKVIGWKVRPEDSGLKDPYNNSRFRITFNEAVNPVNIGNFIKVFAYDPQNTEADGEGWVAVTSSVTATNQYGSVELLGTKPCGLNACGDQMMCWIDPGAVTSSAKSVRFKVVVNAASLLTCQSGSDEWCSRFGGTCSSGSRCLSGSVYYPQSVSVADGLIDMSANSFNGNFNTSTNAKGKTVGVAEGRSGTGTGRSGLAGPYLLNDTLVSTNNYRATYAASDVKGDDFEWQFFVSNQIDNQSPLIKSISPTGNEVFGWQLGQRFSQPIEIVFDRLMSMASLKPGWGYSESKNDESWFKRFLVLKTITARANPIGYWIASKDIDQDGDQMADFTKALINHNPFDQSTTYGPLVGSGVQSMTQNCFLPGGGPQRAADANNSGSNDCHYDSSGKITENCTTNDASTTERVSLPQPASYGYMDCSEIDGTETCDKSTNEKTVSCMVHYYDEKKPETNKAGSWVVTKDSKRYTASNGDVRTDCCFGKCVTK